MSSSSLTGADLLVRRLRQHGVEIVFGYPGGQLTPIYDALQRSPIRHILARDEQAAAFMADGYARASGKPGVCLAVCGPGVYNAATPLATAYTDSIPVLLISGQMATPGLGLRTGYYHENDQFHAVTGMTKVRTRIKQIGDIVPGVDTSLAATTSERPGPVLLEIPLDLQRQDVTAHDEPLPPLALPMAMPSADDIDKAAELINSWKKPLIVVGGGVGSAGVGDDVEGIALHLGAPVFHSFMGKGAVSAEHPLHMGLPWRRATSDLTDMDKHFSPLFAQADGALVLGCRLTQAFTGSWALKLPPSIVQIDIDAAELGRHYSVRMGLQCDLRNTLNVLQRCLHPKPRQPWASASIRTEPWRLPGWDLVGPLRRALPRDGILVADITRLSYILLAEFPAYAPRTFLHPAGFVPMGYGIPAALGAKAACPHKKVLTVEGDGCFLMCGMELASAVQERLPIVVVLINDGSLTLIKAIQDRRYQGRYLGVDLKNPDFGTFAQAFGVQHWRVRDDAAFEQALTQAMAVDEPALVEVML